MADFIFHVSHNCSHVEHPTHLEKILFILSHKSMHIKLPSSVIWTAAVLKVHRLFLTHCFQHQRLFAKMVSIIIMSSAYTLSDDVC